MQSSISLIFPFILCCPLFAEEDLAREPVSAETKFGPVEGEVFVVGGGSFQVDGFRGIPYAQPPVRELQFQKPLPPEPWETVKIARNWPSRCIQSWVLGEVLPKLSSDSLDCLYLNVFAPHAKSESYPDGFPVMIWIHGGGYHFGSSVEYGLKGITERIVPRNIVFVSLHYRLGAYGFFASNDSAALGNYGLWDQRLALEWVQENIGHFKGNPDRVTVFGESAGAGSTALLTLSPHSNKLFDQAILMSGTHLAPWAFNDGPLKHSKILAKKLGCDLPSSFQMLDCIRTKTPSEVSAAEKKVLAAVKHEAQMLFNPVMDNDFFPEPLDELMKKAPTKAIIAGTTHDEMGLFITPPTAKVMSSWTTSDDTFSYQNFKQFLNQVFPNSHFKNAALLRRLALFHYLHTHGDKRNSTFLVEQYTKFLDAQQRYAAGSPVWLYSFDYFSSEAFPAEHKHKGAYHLMELTYLFDTHLLEPFQYDKDDRHLLELMTTLWTNFAKFGSPTPEPMEGFSWYPISSAAPGQYLSIGTHPEMKHNYNVECMAFWKELIPDIERLDLVKPKTKEEKKPAESEDEEQEEVWGHDEL